MKLRAVLTSGRILRRLRGMDAAIREAAIDAAAEALRNELTRAGENVVSAGARGSRRAVGSTAKPGFIPDATVVADVLNLRGGPGIQFAGKGAIPFGTRIDVQEKDQLTGWLRVITPFGATGYVHGGFVRLD
jgi:uncharacterized protein YgiM (DUF1202 family)